MVSLVAVIVAVVELIDPIVVVVVIVEEVVLEDMEIKELGTISIVTEKSDPHIDIKSNPDEAKLETDNIAQSALTS